VNNLKFNQKPLKFVICVAGGPEFPLSIQNWTLARRLAEHGHRVCIVTERQRHDLVGEWHGCQVLTWTSSQPTHLRDALFLWLLLKEFQPDVLITNFVSVYIGSIIGFLVGVKYRIAWYRNLTDQGDLDRPKSSLQWKWMQVINSIAYHLATHVVPVSQAGVEDLHNNFGIAIDKCQIFHTCRPDPIALLNHQLPGKSAIQRIICVGRLVPSKGQDVLIQAFKLLYERHPDVGLELELVGAGSSKQSYLEQVDRLGLRQVVHFTGKLEHLEVLRRLAMAQVMVVPFRCDIGPGVIPEALGMALPVVASACGGMPQLLGNSRAVTFVPPEDPVALSTAIETIICNPELQQAMADEARTLFLAKFHLNHWLNNVEDWLMNITNHYESGLAIAPEN
jgi:glycosyltransferase involved in cell wall biosynthesis